LLQQVALPNPWDANEFLNQLERHRGREIDLCAVPWSFGDGTGAWKRAADYDLIAYAANTTSIHQDHIILHEVGHMVFDHRGRCVLSQQQAHRLAPHLQPAAFAHLLNGTSHRSEEAEAETFATMILARVARQDRREHSRRVLDESTAAALARVTAAFDPS
jgi:Zn-dependent peptidase ImmA (M78 family)